MAQLPPPNSAPALEQLLQERLDQPQRQPEIDAQITAIFAQTHAIVVLDSAGFSHLTETAGIIPALTHIHQLRSQLPPLVAAHQGRVLNTAADNAYLLFPDADTAVQAAIAIRAALQAMQIPVSMGIAYGELLVIEPDDAYGAAFNEASKLGEDIAGSGEIWLTESVFTRLTDPNVAVTPTRFTLSGIEITAYQLQDN